MKNIYMFVAVVLFIFYTFFYRSTGEFQDNKFQLGVNFTAKSYCSCLFVSRSNNKECLDYASLDFISPKLAVDYKAKTTVSSFLFFIKGAAQYMGEDKGCVLL